MSDFDFKRYVVIKSTNGDQVSGFCPFHDDRSPSFSGNRKTGLWICHAGCGGGDFLKFEQMLERDFSGADFYFALQKKRKLLRPQSSKDYFYVDQAMQVRQKVRRLDFKDGVKTFLQSHRSDSGIWIDSAYKGQLAPYRYPNWKDSEENLYFVEGEKCADFIKDSFGFNATTIPGGSNGWKSGYTEFFAGKCVVILPDNDVAGREFAKQVSQSLSAVCLRTTILDLQVASLGGDVIDWHRINPNQNDRASLKRLADHSLSV